MHSSRMHTARSLPYGGVSMTETSRTETPWTPLDRDPQDGDPPWTETETPLWTDRHL